MIKKEITLIASSINNSPQQFFDNKKEIVTI